MPSLWSYQGLSEGYRYGFNGQEKDDEVYGEGNSTTAEFWQYDSRLGRRWNLDPKPNPAISGYACFANSPILFSDPYGDTVKFASTGAEKAYNSMVNFTKNKVSKLEKDVNSINSRIKEFEDKGNQKKAESLRKKLTNVSSELSNYRSVLSELNQLEMSEVVYRIRFGADDIKGSTIPPGSNAGGNCQLNVKSLEIDVNVKDFGVTDDDVNNISSMQRLAHELKHAYQFEVGEISYQGNGRAGETYDITDEYAAFERQNLFAVTPNQKVKDVKKTVNFKYADKNLPMVRTNHDSNIHVDLINKAALIGIRKEMGKSK